MKEENKEVSRVCMENEDIPNRVFSKSFRKRLVWGLCLSGIVSFGEVMQLGVLLYHQWGVWSQTNLLLSTFLFMISMSTCFIALLKIWISEKPFSSILTKGMSFIGILYIVAGLLGWIVPGIQPIGLQMVGVQIGQVDFFIGGNYLTYGMILLVFAEIFKYGALYQYDSELTV
ncbi:MAG: hypothetical protein RSA90_02665 [Lachnospiraceae bacterium]